MFETDQEINEPDVIIEFTPELFNTDDQVLYEGSKYIVGYDSIRYKQRHKVSFWDIRISGLRTNKIKIEFAGDALFSPELFLQLILEPLLTYVLPQRGALSLHACSLTHKRRGALFTGPTGVGKTSLLLNLLGPPDTEYFSDDQTIVKDTTLYPYPLEIGLRKHHFDRIGLKTTNKHWRNILLNQTINLLTGYYPNLTQRIPVSDLDFGNGLNQYNNHLPEPAELRAIFVLDIRPGEEEIVELGPVEAYKHILKHNQQNEDKLKLLCNYLNLYRTYNKDSPDFWDEFKTQLTNLCNNEDINFYHIYLSKRYNVTTRLQRVIREKIENA
jgi:hypothetical protein